MNRELMKEVRQVTRYAWSRCLPLVVALMTTGLAGCTVKYRHEVETPGTESRYTYGAGGFIRYDGYDEVAGDLQVASVDFKKPGSEIVIRLTGVIHIGDLEYYRVLQKECLDTADVVLFEGVKFEGEGAPKPDKDGGDLGRLYSQMGSLLGLGFQKDGIDYARKNFVHCDITVGPDDPLNQQVDPAQMQQAAQMMGPLVTFKNLIAQGQDGVRTEDAMKHQMANVMMMQMGGVEDEELFDKLREAEGLPPAMRERAKKAAKALEGTPIMPGMGMPKEMQEQILHRRNDYVVEQLKARLAGEDPQKKQVIAIFYGAAHNPGIAQAIREWGYQPVSTVWLRAWNMNSRGTGYVAERSDGKSVPQADAPSSPRERPRQPQPKKDREPTLF